MNTIKARILFSLGITVMMFLVVMLLSRGLLNRSQSIRDLQNKITNIKSWSLTVINRDMKLRTRDVIKEEFYSNPTFRENRDLQFNSMLNLIDEIMDHPELTAFEDSIVNDILRLKKLSVAYDSIHQEVMKSLLKRGFKDAGLEGEMRAFIHELEMYDDIIPLQDILMLRRHEKDYFMRDDTVYIHKLNELSQKLLVRIGSKTPRQREALSLLTKYLAKFNEVVVLEVHIGNDSRGLIGAMNRKQEELENLFDSVTVSANIRSTELINGFIRSSRIRVWTSVILSAIFGFIVANYVSQSVRRLAASMQEAIASNFKSEVQKPYSWAAKETKSLYQSYRTLIEKIRKQLLELEETNSLLKEQNAQLTEFNEKLAESERELQESNEIKDKFVSIIGHDLKGPMSSLTALLQMIDQNKKTYSEEQMEVFVSSILKSAQGVSHLLENLLIWSRSQGDRLEADIQPVTVREILNDNLNLFTERLADKDINLISDVGKDVIVLADKNMLDFVLRNLIDNAIKFTKGGGTVEISCRKVDDQTAISISDSGIGIPEEVQKTIFTAIVKKQTVGTNGEKGTGLGLILCKEFVELMKGEIQLHSTPDEGTTFTVSLPTPGEDLIKEPEKEMESQAP